MNSKRLVEVRLASPLTKSDIERMTELVRLNVIAAPAKVVVCGEVTGLAMLQPEWEDVILKAFLRDNPKVERAAFLVSGRGSPFGMQLMRLVRSAGNPQRRVFDDARELVEYVTPALNADELVHVRSLLAQAAA
jgi:hypothetical protein